MSEGVFCPTCKGPRHSSITGDCKYDEVTPFPKIAPDGPCSVCGKADSRCYDTTVPMYLCDTHAQVPAEPVPCPKPAWSLAECKTRHVRHSLNQLPGELTLAQIAAHADRAQLLALVSELAERISEDCHVVDDTEEDRCVDCCPGCDAEDIIEQLESVGGK